MELRDSIREPVFITRKWKFIIISGLVEIKETGHEESSDHTCSYWL